MSPPALLLAVFIDVPAAAHLSRARVLLAINACLNRASIAYQLRTAFLRTNQKTMVPVVTRLVTVAW